MTKILETEQLSDLVWRYRLNAPLIAKKHRPGQFVILRVTDDGERIPLTIADSNAEKGWIDIIFQAVGDSTKDLVALKVDDDLTDLVGPLGNPTHIEHYGRCLCVGGGVGIAPLYPIMKGLKAAGNEVISILGARNADLLILEKAIEATTDTVWIATDDGSRGVKGFVSDVIQARLKAGDHFDFAIIIGPPIMMKMVSAITLEAGIQTMVSLNPIMIDGTGMCGGCRVVVDGKTQFGCVDGPEFNAKGIDWANLMQRLRLYPSVHKHQCQWEK